jgi:hypothetical protein
MLACHHPSGVALADARYGYPFGPALVRLHKGIALGVYELVGSTPPLLALWGSLGKLIAGNDQRVALR